MKDVNLFLYNAKKNRKNYKFEESKEELLTSFDVMIENCQKAKKLLPKAFKALLLDMGGITYD